MQSYSVEAVLGVRDADKFNQAFDNAAERVGNFEKIADGMKSVGKKMTAGITVPVVGMVGAIAKVGAEFDDQLSTVAAVSGATEKEMKQLREQAKELGRDTKFSATNAAEGMEMLSRAGFKATETMDALPSVLNLAAAGAVDLGDAADISSNILSGFGMQAEETSRVADILAQATADSNTDILGMGESMKYVAPIAADLEISIEDTAAAIGFLGDAGIQGGQAGRQLRSGMQKLVAPTESAASAMEELGIEVFDSKGNMKDLPSVIAQFEKGLKGMSSQQRSATLETVFGADAMSSWSVLIGAGSDELGEFSGELANSEGAAKRMADMMEDNLAGSTRSMKSALEGAMISFYELGAGPMKSVIDRITELVRKFTELDDETKQWIAIVALVAAALGPVIWAMGSMVSSVTKLLPILSALLSPVGLIIIAIGLLAGAIIYLWATNEEFREFISEVWESIKGIVAGVIDTVSEHIMTVVDALKEFWDNNIETFLEIAERVFTNIWEVVEIAMGHVQEFIENMLDMIVPFIKKQLDRISQFWEDNGDNIMAIVDFAFGFIKWLIDFVMPIIARIIEGGWDIISSIFDTAVGVIMDIVSFFINLFTGDWEGMKDSAISIFENLWEGVKGIVGGAWRLLSGVFGELWDSIKGWFGDLAKDALQWGKNMIDGFVDGIKSMGSKVADAAKNTVKKAGNFLKFWSPAKKGEGRYITHWGANMIDGFLDGVESQYRNVEKVIGSVTERMRPVFDDAMNDTMNTQLSANVSVNEGTTHSKQPAYVVVRVGRSEFSRFVEDITQRQGLEEDFRNNFG